MTYHQMGTIPNFKMVRPHFLSKEMFWVPNLYFSSLAFDRSKLSKNQIKLGERNIKAKKMEMIWTVYHVVHSSKNRVTPQGICKSNWELDMMVGWSIELFYYW